MIKLRQKVNLDESLDVFACHGMGGTWGALATGLFATKSVNAAGADGLFYGNVGQFGVQFVSVGAVILFSFSVTYILAKLIDMFVGLRVCPNAEEVGLDISEHGERAFV